MTSPASDATAKAAGRGGRTSRQVFASRLQGRPLLDGDDRPLGKIRDIVVLPAVGGDPPRALGLVVQMRRRRIFVSLSRIGEISLDGARLVGGTVDLGGFTLRAGEFLVSDLYGRQAHAGSVADVAIGPSEQRRTGWEVTSLAISRGALRRGSPEIVPWTECRELFEAGTEYDQLAGLREMSPADLATAVVAMPPSRRSQLASALDDAELADVLEEMPEADQVRLLDSLALERSADVVEEMQPDDAADLLASMPAEQRERLLTAMQSAQAADLRRLLRYDASTAGGLMTSQPLIFAPDQTVAEVLARVRNRALPATIAAQVYVCEPPAETPTGLYLGNVGFQRLLRRPPAVEIGQCVEDRVYVRPDLPERELAVRLAAYNMVSVAVCDADGRLLGAVTVDDVLDHLLPDDWRQRLDTDDLRVGNGIDETEEAKTDVPRPSTRPT
ncbi:MAG: magnesium transporter MgtE N-terminal domain-containing protein [Trebonia sp.]